MYHKLLALLCCVSFYSFSFNTDYSSTSSTDSRGKVDETILANLPFSACKMDTPPLSDINCKYVSLMVGGKPFNLLFFNQTLVKAGINKESLTSSTAQQIAADYYVANQDNNIEWSIPTMGNLEWMYDVGLISPKAGEYFWYRSSNGGNNRAFFSNTPAGSGSKTQAGDKASLYRLANNTTPSACTEGWDCNKFWTNKNYYLVFRRDTAAHSMGYMVRYPGFYTGGFVYTAVRRVIEVPSNIKKTQIIIDYCRQGIYACNPVVDMNTVPDINFSYPEPTLCITSHGTVLNTWISVKMKEWRSDC